jgi:hypothetical protein
MMSKRGLVGSTLALFGGWLGAARGALGAPGPRRLAAEQRSEFFTWFHLAPNGAAVPATLGGSWRCFRPESDEFRALVEVAVRIDAAETILGARLSLDRRFIDGRNSPFAQDIAKSFLNWIAPKPRSDALAVLIDHLAAPGLGPGAVLVGRGGAQRPITPDSTGGLAVYRGSADRADYADAALRLAFANLAGLLPNPAAGIDLLAATPPTRERGDAWFALDAALVKQS